MFQIFSFGWTLFLVSKGKLLNDPTDLVNMFNLLMCCINLIFSNAPPSLKQFSESMLDGKFNENNLATKYLAYMCQSYQVPFSEVLKVHETLFIPFLLMLKKNDILKLQDNAIPKMFSLDGLLDKYLQQNKQNINKEYDIMYYDSGDFDERFFIDERDQIGTPSKVPSQTRNYFHLKPKQIGLEATIASPYKYALNSPAPSSPMSTTLAGVAYLKSVLSSREPSPSSTLLRFFSSCDRDVTKSIEDRITNLVGSLRSNDESDSERIELGIKLYYRTLEAMVVAEEKRLHQSNFTTLLNHENFHRSLLACCMEIVLFSYKMTHMAFPFVLQKFHIKPFDFCKIIESVVRYDPELPRAVVKHISGIEEKILESMAWEEGSPLLELAQDKSNQQNIINHLLSPQKQPLQSLVSPMSTKTNSTSVSKSHSLDLFYRKVFQLAYVRSKNLCQRLNVPPRIFQQVLEAVAHALTEKIFLITNRHLDQIILCSIYGVCRVNQIKEITFKIIIEQYKVQPQSSSKIFREVFLNDGKFADIISFYNAIFIPSMEEYLLQFQLLHNEENAAPMSPNKPVPHSPKVTPNVNLYLSPMRAGVKQALTSSSFDNIPSDVSTPKSNAFLFSVGESPAKVYSFNFISLH